MARNPARGGTLLVELKAVEGGYPLYGRLETRPGQPLDELLAGGGAVVEEAVLGRLGLVPGDTLAIGDASLTVTGVVGKEPDRAASLFTLGPRVLLNPASLEATGLVRLGSRVRHRTLVRLPPGLDPRAARAALVEAMADPAVRVATFDEAQPGLRRFFDQLTTYLRLVGVTSLLVGGIGVAAAVRAFLARKVGTIAILRCLGASARTVTAVYLVQALALGALGSLAGAALGTAAQLLLGPLLRPFVPFELDARAAPGSGGGRAPGGVPRRRSSSRSGRSSRPARSRRRSCCATRSTRDACGPAGRGRPQASWRPGWPRSRSGRRGRSGSARSSWVRRRERSCSSPSQRGQPGGSPDGSRARARSPGVTVSMP